MTTILIISPEPWEAHSVSKHHYARELAKRGHYVLFMGPPETGPMHLEHTEVINGNVIVVRSPQIAPGLRFFPALLRRALEACWLKRLEFIAKRKVEVVWLFENSRFFDMRFAADRLKIYHQVDLNQNYNPHKSAATADLSIAVSAPIYNLLEPNAKKLIRITHGCTPLDWNTEKPDGLDHEFSDASVNAMMTGNLSIKYLDILLVKKLVRRHPKVKFHFVGSYIKSDGLHAALSNMPNAVFWGPQPSSMLATFLRHADVLLVAYQADKDLEQLANPHKIMEYLASGRVTLCSRTLEYEERLGLVEVVNNHDEYLARFDEIVTDVAAWNKPNLILRRQEYAADNSYSRQLDRIAKALGSQGRLIS